MDRWYRSCLDSIGIHMIGLLIIGMGMVYWPVSPPAPSYVEIDISGGGMAGGSGGPGDNVGGITMPVKSAGTEAMVQATMKAVDQAIESGDIVISKTMANINDTSSYVKTTSVNQTNVMNNAASMANDANGNASAADAGDGLGNGGNPDGHGAYGSGTGSGSGSGNGDGDADGDGRGYGEGAGDGLGSGFSLGGDGVYTATDGSGIDYTLIRDAQGNWPDEARTVGYSKVVRINVRILVDTDGSIADVELLNDAPNLGFKEEAVRAAYNMRFAPIYYEGHNIRMYMVKPIEFYPQ